MDAQKSFMLYNWDEDQVSNRKTLSEALDDARRLRLDGYSVWQGHFDEDDEFVHELRVSHADLNSPSNETWDDCARLMVKGGRTMWQLWTDDDPAAPRSLAEDDAWPRIPDVERMRQILRQAGGADPSAKTTSGLDGARL